MNTYTYTSESNPGILKSIFEQEQPHSGLHNFSVMNVSRTRTTPGKRVRTIPTPQGRYVPRPEKVAPMRRILSSWVKGQKRVILVE